MTGMKKVFNTEFNASVARMEPRYEMLNQSPHYSIFHLVQDIPIKYEWTEWFTGYGKQQNVDKNMADLITRTRTWLTLTEAANWQEMKHFTVAWIDWSSLQYYNNNWDMIQKRQVTQIILRKSTRIDHLFKQLTWSA